MHVKEASGVKVTITEDRAYKPSSPGLPARRYYLETESYRWSVFLWEYELKETGTPLFMAKADEGFSAYGFTRNEAINGIASIMGRQVRAFALSKQEISLEKVRHYLDKSDVERESQKPHRRK
jgi:hypothetical protein